MSLCPQCSYPEVDGVAYKGIYTPGQPCPYCGYAGEPMEKPLSDDERERAISVLEKALGRLRAMCILPAGAEEALEILAASGETDSTPPAPQEGEVEIQRKMLSLLRRIEDHLRQRGGGIV